jgi:coenzyme F420-reducing hydrogenase alpha subunit
MKTIKVDYLARVEGDGALRIRFRGDHVRDVELRIFEPPRFFEAFLRGRSFGEVPDITARICGICPVAYQMSSCRALEDALEVRVTPHIDQLRRLLYCGEWVESHALHMFLLHAPDFLGYPDAMAMARDHREIVVRGLQIKKAGNAIVSAVGGREVHPVNVKVGGFYRTPAREEMEKLAAQLEAARDAALEALERMARFDFPDFNRDYEFVALRGAEDYPFIGNRIVSNRGLDIEAAEYDQAFVEQQVPHSHALHSTVRGRGAYLCGPMARFNLNFERLRPLAQDAARRARIPLPCRNPFMSLLVRAVETVHALDEALRLLGVIDWSAESSVAVRPRACAGYGASEAPRGLLYHRYHLDDSGRVLDAKIVPPTSQNQLSIEHDLRELAAQMVRLTHDEATVLAERAIRNYDPCISCATHFLDLAIERE